MSKDSKDSTYKFALLRGIVECVINRNSHHGKDEKGWDVYPLGLLIYYWILYYYPLFSHSRFIPQKNGESPSLKKGKTIAFRREFNKIIGIYRHRGGLAQFRYDLIHQCIPQYIGEDVIKLLRKIQYTVKDMPMKHFGYSKFGEHYSLVHPDNNTIRTPSFEGLIKEAGTFSINPKLHELLENIGSLILGHDSIINGWADFTYNAAKRNENTTSLSKEHILEVLNKSVDIPRDIGQVRKVLESHQTENLRCIWTGKRLGHSFHVDHAIPYSLWQNNNLWNLLPVKSSVNSRKSDLIPTPSLIKESAQRIKDVWKIYSNSFENQFRREVFEGLGVEIGDNMDPAIKALTDKSRYLIDKRGFKSFSIN